MKNIATTILVVVIIIIGVFLAISFQVRTTELALVTRFGEPVRKIIEPGFKLRWPIPVERVHKFDKRMRLFEADLSEITTKGAVPIIINSFIIWKIEDPLKYFNSVGTVEKAEAKLLSYISDTQNNIIGRHSFSEFVNNDPEKIRFEQIQDEMLANIKEPVMNEYGIEITAIGIKQLKVNEDTTKDVFDRMRAERIRKTEAIIAEGQAEATKIKSDTDGKKTELLAAADAMAKAIQGKGDAEAAQYYEMLRADPDFAIFLDNIDTLKSILKERSTIVFSADADPFKLLKEAPDLKPKK